MKKGFTLVELLAVIVILAVILIIAIPQVLKVVDNSRINAYIKNEQMVLKAVDVYVSRNTGELPGEQGDTTEISVNHLITNGFLTEITNPYNKNEYCTGYVTITKLSDTEYNYIPHLKCGLDINTSSEDGLIAHYPLENNAYDYSINNNHGDIYGNVICTEDGKKGKACSFNDFPAHIDLPIGSEITLDSDYTFSMWVKPNVITGNPIFFASHNGSNQRVYISIYGSKWDIGIQGSPWNTSLSNTFANTNWNHIVLVFCNGEAELYVNNEFSMKKNYTTYSLSSNFRLGLHRIHSSTYQFRGLIDEIKIYNRALSEQEIKFLYESTK